MWTIILLIVTFWGALFSDTNPWAPPKDCIFEVIWPITAVPGEQLAKLATREIFIF